MEPIPVFVGISRRFDSIRGMTERSILEHTNASVEIRHLYPEVEAGCTGFSNVRYTIRRGIYLDCDMVVLGDISELWGYRAPGRFVCMQDGSTEVAVIDCVHGCSNKWEQHLLPKDCRIPAEWNCEDCVPPGAKLVHFTNLKTQPWFFDHPDPVADALWRQYI